MASSDLFPADLGPIYKETIAGRFPVEPWNTFSNIFFLLILVHFILLLRKQRSIAPIFLVTLPILTIGFIGGTLFHATRAHRIWLFMDFIPIFILALLASYYFWSKLLERKAIALLICLLPFLLMRGVALVFPAPRHITISLGYSTLALTIVLPALLFSRSHHWLGIRSLSLALTSFVLAVSFRIYDSQSALPMGTHFLWHTFGAFSTYCIMKFLFLAEASVHPVTEQKSSSAGKLSRERSPQGTNLEMKTH